MARPTMNGWPAGWLLLLALVAGCSGGPVLRTEEAVPSQAAYLDEATELVTRRHLSNFKLCVQRSRLVDNSSLAGHPMDVVFTILPDGRTSHVKLLSERYRGSAFASCVMRILTWIRFASPGDESRQLRLRLFLDEKAPLGRGG